MQTIPNLDSRKSNDTQVKLKLERHICEERIQK
jgi:hypothetical protein